MAQRRNIREYVYSLFFFFFCFFQAVRRRRLEIRRVSRTPPTYAAAPWQRRTAPRTRAHARLQLRLDKLSRPYTHAYESSDSAGNVVVDDLYTRYGFVDPLERFSLRRNRHRGQRQRPLSTRHARCTYWFEYTVGGEASVGARFRTTKIIRTSRHAVHVPIGRIRFGVTLSLFGWEEEKVGGWDTFSKSSFWTKWSNRSSTTRQRVYA